METAPTPPRRSARGSAVLLVAVVAIGTVVGVVVRQRYGIRILRKLGLDRRSAPAPAPEALALVREIDAAAAAGRRAEEAALRAEFVSRYPRSWQAHRQTLAQARAAGFDRAHGPLQLYTAQIPEEPRRHAAMALVGELALAAGQDPVAARMFDEAMTHPTTSAARSRTALAFGLVLLRLGRTPEAHNILGEAAQGILSTRDDARARAGLTIATPGPVDTPERRRALAAAHRVLGDREASERAWAAEGPELAPADQLARADNLAALGQHGAAAQVYQLVTASSPGGRLGEDALLGWARSLVAAGAHARARDRYRTLLDRYPAGRRRVAGLLGLGDVEVRLQAYAAARAAYEEALRIATSDGSRWAARLSIGWCRIRAGEVHEAIRFLEPLIPEAGAYRPRIRWALADAYAKAGDRELSIAQLWLIIDEAPSSDLAARARQRARREGGQR